MSGEIRRDHVTTVFGRKGTGKSELARYLFTLMGTRYRGGGRICIDTKDEHADELPGVPSITSPAAIFSSQTVRAVPPDPTDEEWFDELFRFAFDEGDTTIWCEELNAFTSPSKAPKWMKIYLYQGRRRKCGFIGTNQRPAEQHGCFLSQADHVIVYPLQYRLDREAVARHLDVEHVDVVSELLDELPEYGFLHFDVAAGELSSSGPVHDPDALTDALSKLYFGPYDPT